ncbi:MAG: hypothetical protein AAF726_02835 [Planctomycetota bacterium]
MVLVAPSFAASIFLVGLVLLRVLPQRGGRRDALVLCVVTTLAILGGLVGGVVFGSGFAVLRLWFDATYYGLAPLGLVVAGVAWRERRTGTAIALGLASLSVLAVATYATRVEPQRLQVNRHAVQSDRLPARQAEPLVVAILADLQTDRIGSYEQRVFEELDALEADLWLLPGDYLQCRTPERTERARAELAALFDGVRNVPRLGIWAVDGDVDQARESLTSERVQFLDDASARFEEEGVQIVGLTTPSSRRSLTKSVVSEIDAFEGLTIVFGHAPDYMIGAIEGRLGREAVLVAGHTHGGQVVVPGFGPPLTLTRAPRWLAAGGIHRGGEVTLCVSRGVGLERSYAPRVRLFCPPEIVVLELFGPLR